MYSPSLFICNFCISYLCLISTLLWHQILSHLILDHTLVYTDSSSSFSILVALLRSVTVPLHLIVICIKLKYHTEFRHIRQTFSAIIGQLAINSSISEHLVFKLTLSFRFSIEIILIQNTYIIFLNTHLRFCRSCIHTCYFPLTHILRHMVTVVVVNRSSPEVRLWHFSNQLFSCILIRSKTTGNFRKQDIEVLSLNSDVKIANNQSWTRRSDFFLFTYHLNYTLSKCNLMSGISPNFSFFGSKGYINNIFP